MTADRHYPLWHPVLLLATWFGSGLAPKAKGTMGTLAALPFAAAIHYYGGHFGLLGAAIVTFAFGVWISDAYMKRTGTHDPGEIVIDEVAGIWLLLAPLPLSLQSYLIGFLLFRFFDIVKPWPVSVADRKMQSALGVMVDDIMAAFYPYFLLIAGLALLRLAGHDGNVVPWLQWLERCLYC